MKRIFYFLIAALCFLASCSDQDNFCIDLTGLRSDTLLLSIRNGADFSRIRMDTVALHNGKAKVSLPDSVLLLLDISEYTRTGNRWKGLTKTVFFLPGDQIRFSGTAGDIHVSGSEIYDHLLSNKAYQALEKELRQLELLYTEAYQTRDRSLLDSLQKEFTRIDREESDLKMKIIQSDPSSLTAGFLSTDLPAKQGAEAIKLLSEEVKNGPLGEIIRINGEQYDKYLTVQRNRENIKSGNPAPDFKLKDLDGKTWTLASFKGKYLLLDFWGSWCGWCIKGMPQMKKYYAKYSGKVEFAGICCGDKDEKWRKAIAKYELPWVNLYGEGSDITVTYGISGFPTKILIDPQGKIVEVFVGESPHLYHRLDELF